MPQFQYLNLQQPIQENALDKTLQSFSSHFMEAQDRKREADALEQIYKQYQGQEGDIFGQTRAIHSNPNLGPTAKVNAINQLQKVAEYNAARQKEVSAAQEKQRNREATAKLGIDPDLDAGLQKAQYENQLADERFKTITGSQPNQQPSLNPGAPLDSTEPSPSPQLGLAGLSDKQLVGLSGVKGYAEPAKQQLKQNQKAKAEMKADERFDREEKYKFHKESAKYDEGVNDAAKAAKNQIEAIKDVREALSSNKDTRKTLSNVFKGFGKIGDKISDALLSKDQAIIQASVPAFLEGRKELFGVRLSDADLAILKDKLPDIGKSPPANRAILNLMERYSKKAILREQIGADLKEKNGGLRPLNYASEIEKRFDEKMKPVKIRNPNTGKVALIPSYEAADYLIGGGELINE